MTNKTDPILQTVEDALTMISVCASERNSRALIIRVGWCKELVEEEEVICPKQGVEEGLLDVVA